MSDGGRVSRSGCAAGWMIEAAEEWIEKRSVFVDRSNTVANLQVCQAFFEKYVAREKSIEQSRRVFDWQWFSY